MNIDNALKRVLALAVLAGGALGAANDGTQVVQADAGKGKPGKVFREIADLPVACRRVEAVKGEAPSLLPEGRALRLAWHDEFDGAALDAGAADDRYTVVLYDVPQAEAIKLLSTYSGSMERDGGVQA